MTADRVMPRAEAAVLQDARRRIDELLPAAEPLARTA
jgi:hypothetical protein